MPRVIQALPETISKAQEFTNIINALLSIIDELSMEIPEGKYLECMNLLKNLHGFKPNENMNVIIHNIIENNPIITEQRNRVLASPLQKKNKIEKNMTICKFCDTKITKNHLAEHQTTRKCLNIRKTKKLSAYSGKLQTSDIKLQVDKMKNFNIRFTAMNCIYWWRYNTWCYVRENMMLCLNEKEEDNPFLNMDSDNDINSDSDNDSITDEMIEMGFDAGGDIYELDLD